MFGTDPNAIFPLTEAEAAQWVTGLETHSHAWIVEHQGKLLGEVRLDRIERNDQRAQLAIGLYDPAKLGISLGRETMRLVLRYAFKELGLHRIGIRVIDYNERAIRCYQACGFQIEGREREAARVTGTWHDDIIMGLLAQDYADTF